MTKLCPKCETEYSTSFFNKANRRDGLRSWCKGCERTYQQDKIADLKSQVYHKLGDKCAHCGFSDKRALQIDHVKGGGNKEHAEIKNNRRFLQKVLEDAEGSYQILCANCNWIKRHERAEVVRESKLSEEGRRKISESRSQWSPTDEQRKKMVDSHTGKVTSQETKDRLASSTSESWKDPEVRASRITGQTGKKWTTEQRENYREVARRREAKKREERLAAA